MTFFGTITSLEKWREIIATDLRKIPTAIQIVKGRAQFSVDLTTSDRDYLQTNVWYRKDHDAPQDHQGKPMPWNWRISFRE